MTSEGNVVFFMSGSSNVNSARGRNAEEQQIALPRLSVRRCYTCEVLLANWHRRAALAACFDVINAPPTYCSLSLGPTTAMPVNSSRQRRPPPAEHTHRDGQMRSETRTRGRQGGEEPGDPLPTVLSVRRVTPEPCILYSH